MYRMSHGTCWYIFIHICFCWVMNTPKKFRPRRHLKASLGELHASPISKNDLVKLFTKLFFCRRKSTMTQGKYPIQTFALHSTMLLYFFRFLHHDINQIKAGGGKSGPRNDKARFPFISDFCAASLELISISGEYFNSIYDQKFFCWFNDCEIADNWRGIFTISVRHRIANDFSMIPIIKSSLFLTSLFLLLIKWQKSRNDAHRESKSSTNSFAIQFSRVHHAAKRIISSRNHSDNCIVV